MTRHWTLGPLATVGGAALLMALVSSARAESPEVVVRQLLQANPVLAPYNLLTAQSNGRVVIAGTVGTKQLHDLAIRLAIATGYPIRDDLVIDTGAAHRVAAARAQAQLQARAAALVGPTAAGLPNPGLVPSLGAAPGTLGMTPGTFPYVYPPPLFGRIDDPFFGFEPPLLSYPPWWRAIVARSQAYANTSAPAANPVVPNPAATVAPGTVAAANPATSLTIPLGTSPQDGTVEMTIDPRGIAVLRGTVPTLADRIAIGQKIAQTPGVTEVLNLLQVTVNANPETPPPPPQPAPPAQDPNAPPQPAIVVDAGGGALSDRLSQAFARRPALANLPIKVTVRDGVATLSGKVPTVYEAMLAFRVVEQTPGITDVIDQLEFVVPDGERQNPLIKQGRPEDVEPYLLAQVRRHVGDLAHVDRVRLLGDSLELWGTLVHAEDRPRLDAILRSIAVLRGFRLEPHFDAD